MTSAGTADLFWIPLGAGSPVVRSCGKLYERINSAAHRRMACDLYHSALVVSLPEGDFMIEQTPIPDLNGQGRGVVAEGPVGMRSAGCFRLFRYEIRCWREGSIPDLGEAIASPVRLTDDLDLARHIIDTLKSVPTPTWGRDELHAGEMWNSNSVIAWVLTQSGFDLTDIEPPVGSRAPGWSAGVRVAARSNRPASTVQSSQ